MQLPLWNAKSGGDGSGLRRGARRFFRLLLPGHFSACISASWRHGGRGVRECLNRALGATQAGEHVLAGKLQKAHTDYITVLMAQGEGQQSGVFPLTQDA